MEHDAIFSDCRRYRYQLRRTWDTHKNRCVFIGLNPSTANETKDDATLRRCLSFARQWGYGELVMLNLFAYRSTSPRGLYEAKNPVGAKNNEYILEHTLNADDVVACWGNHGGLLNRDSEVKQLLDKQCLLQCLGMTQKIQPVHPLYQPNNANLIPLPN